MRALRNIGLRTVTVSPFGERHGAWHWYAGFNEIYNPGLGGHELADDVTPLAMDWLKRNGKTDNWFLHVNYWDPHTPYRTPMEYGNPFSNEPIAPWLTEEVRARLWEGYGPHSAQEHQGSGGDLYHLENPRIPETLDSMAAVKQWIDGYDVGIRYADEHVGRVLNSLADLNVLDDTWIIVSADHGENHGELNIWGDHHTADNFTCRVPLIFRAPGLLESPVVNDGLHYQFDFTASLINLLGGSVPGNWDGISFADSIRKGEDEGRDFLVVSQCAWSCQRGIRFEDYLCLRTYHAGLKQLDPVMLFDLANDPHEQINLADNQPEIVHHAMSLLSEWESEMKMSSQYDVDPLTTVLREGGPFHTRGKLSAYVERLRRTGRSHHAESLLKQYPDG
jgi:arylsulfatase A-like enzyme